MNTDNKPLTPLEHLQNVMGCVDTPIARRRLGIDVEQPEWLTGARAFLRGEQDSSAAPDIDAGVQQIREELAALRAMIDRGWSELNQVGYTYERDVQNKIFLRIDRCIAGLTRQS